MTNEAVEKTVFDLKETICQTLMTPTNKAGWPFIIGFALVSVIIAMLSTFLGVVGLVLTLWCIYFFRDPVRMVPQKPNLIISPADGKVTAVTSNVQLPTELREAKDETSAESGEDTGEESIGNYTRISIFLSVFDVHVNRVPTSGTIKKVIYRPGQFLNAGSERASIENERSSVLMELDDNRQIAFVQIAGLIARRIINELKEGDTVVSGNRFGLIRFGSRMDIYIPSEVQPCVAVGQRAIGGETILADMSQKGEALTASPV
ncbi:MAG TPA: phosphatidylserine decarboxylase [Alphaproteobacteria bacterium]|nr:phosphatidylserine decarboxylase [Alphaproteobacteria bacterium]HOO51296.1 phosphatidylserine decarboxylase [Alphaproteobacteria bacterium]